MKIIAISGHAQNGKDTVAGMLKEHLEGRNQRVLITHYADLLKYICRTFFGWDGEKNEKGRKLLQVVGTDVIRAKQPDYWVRFVAGILELFGDNWDCVLIPDSRFPNEIETLRQDGFNVTHVRVERHTPGWTSPLTFEQQRHPSETALDEYPVDIMVNNDGSLDELNEKCAVIANEICSSEPCR